MAFDPNTTAGIIYGPNEHHIDHIAPLCALLDLPIIVTEDRFEKLISTYYPSLVVYYFDYLKGPEEIYKNYTCLISSLPKTILDTIFYLQKNLQKKEVKTIWCPHGNSDKGVKGFFFEALKNEEILLVYGDALFKRIKDKNALQENAKVITTGNYRAHYFNKYKEMGQHFITDKVTQFLPDQQTILYAPTWEDHEKACSFPKALRTLCEKLPNNKNLIIKLHPNSLQELKPSLQKLIWDFERKNNILFLKDFPLIYPLLDYIDVYLGDTSSIGYDMLYFDKPMFFLTLGIQNNDLSTCGTLIEEADFDRTYEIIDDGCKTDKQHFCAKRKSLYEKNFFSGFDPEEIKKQLSQAL